MPMIPEVLHPKGQTNSMPATSGVVSFGFDRAAANEHDSYLMKWIFPPGPVSLQWQEHLDRRNKNAVRPSL